MWTLDNAVWPLREQLVYRLPKPYNSSEVLKGYNNDVFTHFTHYLEALESLEGFVLILHLKYRTIKILV